MKQILLTTLSLMLLQAGTMATAAEMGDQIEERLHNRGDMINERLDNPQQFH